MKSRGDYVPALILVVLGVVFAVSSLDYGVIGEGARIGPGFLPCLVGLLLIVFGATIVWETWQARTVYASSRQGDAGMESVADRDDNSFGNDKDGTAGSVALIFGMLTVAVFLTPHLGFLLAFSLLVFTILAVVEREKIWFSLIIAIGIGVLAWLIFEAFMGIGLPAGLLDLIAG